MDLASASYYDDKIAWYENMTAMVPHGKHVVTTEAVAPWFIADVDGDGDMDLASASPMTTRLRGMKTPMVTARHGKHAW